MRIVFALLIALVLASCSREQDAAMFEQHVYSGLSATAIELRSGKMSCLHCPMFFRFNGAPELQHKIIESHALNRVASLPTEIRDLNRTIAEDAEWWHQGNHLAKAKYFLATYVPLKPSNDPAFRVMIVVGEQTYFITTGHFDEASYVRGKA